MLVAVGDRVARELASRPAVETPWQALRACLQKTVAEPVDADPAEALPLFHLLYDTPDLHVAHLHKQAAWAVLLTPPLLSDSPPAISPPTISPLAIAPPTVRPAAIARRCRLRRWSERRQVNHLAPFLLTHLLLDNLTAAGATVINTASSAAKNYGHLDPDDLQNQRRYSPNKAYGDAKLANILHAQELQRRYGDSGIHAASFDPGNVATNFASDTSSWFRSIYRTPLRKLALTTPGKGSRTLLWLIAGTPGQTWTPGGFSVNNEPGTTNPQADDAPLTRRVWDRSAELLGLTTA